MSLARGKSDSLATGNLSKKLRMIRSATLSTGPGVIIVMPAIWLNFAYDTRLL
jgi:hypothetical protein